MLFYRSLFLTAAYSEENVRHMQQTWERYVILTY